MTHFHNVGDWVLFEFNLVQIKQMKGPNITEVNDGLFSTSSRSLNSRVRLLTMRNKIISQIFEDSSKQVHGLNNNLLNYPDIHRKLGDLWVEACDIIPSPPKEKELQEMYSRLRKFTEHISKASVATIPKGFVAEGVRIFREQ